MKDTNIATIESRLEPQKQKIEKKNGLRIGYYYIVYKSLKNSLKNDVVKCFYIKGLFNFGLCVIKEGLFGDSKDKEGRDITDRLRWQYELHRQLQEKVRVPRLIDNFEENGSYYLVMEMIRGQSYSRYLKKNKQRLQKKIIIEESTSTKALRYLIQITDLVSNLHEEQVVHRDLTPANFIITPFGKIALIDLELSYSIKLHHPMPAFTLGTYGYMSQEQIAVSEPSLNEDIFALGAIILQTLSGIHPLKLTDGEYEDIIRRVNFFVPDSKMSNLICRCLHPSPSSRASLNTIGNSLRQYKNDISQGIERSKNERTKYDDSAVCQVIQQTINTLSTRLLSDDDGWFAADIANPHDHNHKINKAYYASFAHGDAGIVYLLSEAKAAGFDTSNCISLVEKALEKINRKYISRIDSTIGGLANGSDGIAAVLSNALNTGLIDNSDSITEWINILLDHDLEAYNISEGISGQGYAFMYCQNYIPNYQIKLSTIAGRLISNQQPDGSWSRTPGAAQHRKTKGFFNGIAGIAHFLLSYANMSNDIEAIAAGEKALHWLSRQSHRRNESLYWKSASNKELEPWWHEGGPGIALAFIKGFQVTNKPLYKKIARAALLVHPKKLIEDNLSQLKGASGLGEIYLEAYKVFGESEWKERADWIVQLIMQLRKQHSKYGPYWLVEDERQPTASFMAGNTGVIHFLLRYCNANMHLPLFL